MEKKNDIEYYSDFTNYLDSNGCYGNFYMKRGQIQDWKSQTVQGIW